jgi:arylsulfatase
VSARRSPSLALLALLAACAGGDDFRSAPAPAAGRLDAAPSIVVVTIDTLRADHVHAYGYHRETSPHLDALAAEGVLFERAFATMATTLPSHVSLFSGLYAHQHGVAENRWRRAPFSDGDDGLRSVAQLLRDDGYTTAAFVSAAPVKRVTGLAAGFDVFEEPLGYEMKGAPTPDQAIAWIERGPREPFFLWVHLWDPHEPNRPSGEWAGRFSSDDGLDAVIDRRGIDPARLERAFAAPALRRFLAPRNGERDGPPPVVDRDAVRDMLNRYDADVAAADREVGRIVEALRRRGVLDRAVVMVTADHGQSLGQHDWLPHGRITDDNLRVPLIVRFPPGVVRAPLRVTHVTSLVDALPTVLARFDGEASRRFQEQAEGEDALSGHAPRGWALAQRTGRERAGWEAGGEYALVTGRWKLVRRAGGDEELYDLAADPGERHDVSASNMGVVADLHRTLDDALERRGAPPAEGTADGDAAVPEDQLEALRSLGYVDD